MALDRPRAEFRSVNRFMRKKSHVSSAFRITLCDAVTSDLLCVSFLLASAVPGRETSEEAQDDRTHLQEACQESLAALQARATAMTAEAISNKRKLHRTLVDTISVAEARAL